MWKPNIVVPEHRWRARFVWCGLLASIVAYTIWQIWSIVDGYKHPGTSLGVTNETFQFPYVLMCFFPGAGCSYADGTEDQCTEDAYSNGNVYDQNGLVEDVVESEDSNCVGFNLGKIDLTGVPPEDARVEIETWWTVTDLESVGVPFFDHVSIHLSEEYPEESTLSFLNIPYTLHLPSDEATVTLDAAELTIGKTTKKNLNGDVTTTYPTFVLSSSLYTDDNRFIGETNEVGYLSLFLRQGYFSRTSVEEINPLDLASFFGNIGGFWELLIVFWGVFFIATREESEPKMTARDFSKVIQPVKKIVGRRRSLSVDSAPAPEEERRPDWDSANRGGSPAPAAARDDGAGEAAAGTAAAVGFPISPADKGGSTTDGENRLQHSVDAGFRRPVVEDAPVRRGSRSPCGPPASQGPAPSSFLAISPV